MSGTKFGALVAHDGITLVECRIEHGGLRIVEQATDATPSTSIEEALDRLVSLIRTRGHKRAAVSLAIEQFGVLHHVMTLPGAERSVLEPIVKRETQRLFGVNDPVVTFSRGSVQERREPRRANAATAPRQVFVAAAHRALVDALATHLAAREITVEVVTVVPKAIHSLYEASGGSLEPTAVLACLESGPHLGFFLDGKLQLTIDPPIALEGDRPSVSAIVDQVERGTVYFRQQFRGASPSRVLLSARQDQYAQLAAELERRLGTRVAPLFSRAESPEAVIAMGAVLEAGNREPLDLYPHPPTIGDRFTAALRGPNGAVAGAVVLASAAALWAVVQVNAAARLQKDNATLVQSVASAVPLVEPMRRVAERRADALREVEFVRSAIDERIAITNSLGAIASTTPDGVVFDSLAIARDKNGWSAVLRGRSRGQTAAQAVHGLESFLQTVRTRPNVASASLVTFDYAPLDTLQRGAGLTLHFNIAFAIARPAGVK